MGAINQKRDNIKPCYQFPAIRTGRTRDEQMQKIVEEVSELIAAMAAEGEARQLEELWDVVHACETLLRMYKQSGAVAALFGVFAKNKERGYYE